MKTIRSGALRWPPLIPGTLRRRYRRFLADVALEDGSVVTAHCPNSGSMKGCSDPGRPVYLSLHDRPERKLKYTWELIRMPNSLVGVNTLVPNRLVPEAVKAGAIEALKGYDRIKAEVRSSPSSRIDLLLEKKGRRKCFVEIKNCTLVEDGIAAFPDAVTARGRKHLAELQDLIHRGHRSVMLFLVQRSDARRFQPAHSIDPEYGKALRRAHAAGVEVLVYDVRLDLKSIAVRGSLPFRL